MSRFGGRCLRRVIEFGYEGEILPINPRFQELQGLRCYPSLADLPRVPDHVGVMVPAEAVLDVLQECARIGVSFATVFTGGFSESGTIEGRAMQAAINALARETGMRIMGPNCNGLINFRDGFAMTTTATIAGARRPAGDIAVVSQSGGVGQVNTMWRAQASGLDVSYEVSCGNSADLDVIDFLNFMVDDEATNVILMVVEQIPNGARLAEAAGRAADRCKPIVMLKLGRTEAGGRAAASHTGAMAGSDVVADAALRQMGIIRVTDTPELYEHAMLLRQRRWPRGNRIATTTPSGGNAVLLVDLGSAHGLTWPDYQPDTSARLAEVLPKLGSATNPTDVTNVAIGRADIYRAAFEAIGADDNIDALIPIFTMSASGDLQAASDASKEIDKPVALLWTGGCSDKPEITARHIVAKGVPVFTDTMACIRSMGGLIDFSRFLRRREADRAPVRPNDIDRAAVAECLAGARGSLTERLSRSVLAAYGFSQLRHRLAQDADEAARIADNFNMPVVLKIESPDIPHKTDAGGVRLNLRSGGEVRAAFDAIMASCAIYAPGASLNGVVVQEMADTGLDMIVGLQNDADFGPVVVAGLGGIHVEVMRDMVYRVAPVTPSQAREMLQELKAYPLLRGYRGSKPSDIEALADAIVRLSWLGHDFRDEIAEVDINPLRVGEAGKGLSILDALIVMKPQQ